MSCNKCKARVENAANSLDIVKEAIVNLDKKEVSVTFKELENVSIDSVKKIIEEAGYNPI